MPPAPRPCFGPPRRGPRFTCRAAPTTGTVKQRALTATDRGGGSSSGSSGHGGAQEEVVAQAEASAVVETPTAAQ